MAGKVVHIEIPSADVDRAVGFYSAVFGWEIGPSAMEGFEYRMFQTAEDAGGAVMGSETPGSGLVVYLETDDIDGSIAKVRSSGGSADDKQPVPTHGWFSACTDTEGNKFSLWQGDPNAA